MRFKVLLKIYLEAVWIQSLFIASKLQSQKINFALNKHSIGLALWRCWHRFRQWCDLFFVRSKHMEYLIKQEGRDSYLSETRSESEFLPSRHTLLLCISGGIELTVSQSGGRGNLSWWFDGHVTCAHRNTHRRYHGDTEVLPPRPKMKLVAVLYTQRAIVVYWQPDSPTPSPGDCFIFIFYHIFVFRKAATGCQKKCGSLSFQYKDVVWPV